MTPDQLGQELPDSIRMIVWARKEKYQIDGCCFGIETTETPCFEPTNSTGSNRIENFPLILLFCLYIAIGIYKF